MFSGRATPDALSACVICALGVARPLNGYSRSLAHSLARSSSRPVSFAWHSTR